MADGKEGVVVVEEGEGRKLVRRDRRRGAVEQRDGRDAVGRRRAAARVASKAGGGRRACVPL